LACCRSFYRLARLSFQREHDKSKLQEKIWLANAFQSSAKQVLKAF
jgi:hypothetical protein